MSRTETQSQALSNATNNASMANYPAIFSGFAAKGIAQSDITPRVNIFTYEAWHALGRQVKRGEHGVSVTTWIPMTKKDADGEAQPIGRKPRSTTVFHVSQTEPRNGYSENLWKYALKHGSTTQAADDVAQAEAMQPEPVQRQQTAEQQGFTIGGYYSTEFTPS